MNWSLDLSLEHDEICSFDLSLISISATGSTRLLVRLNRSFLPLSIRTCSYIQEWSSKSTLMGGKSVMEWFRRFIKGTKTKNSKSNATPLATDTSTESIRLSLTIATRQKGLKDGNYSVRTMSFPICLCGSPECETNIQTSLASHLDALVRYFRV